MACKKKGVHLDLVFIVKLLLKIIIMYSLLRAPRDEAERASNRNFPSAVINAFLATNILLNFDFKLYVCCKKIYDKITKTRGTKPVPT